jgi:hypothetical protein
MTTLSIEKARDILAETVWTTPSDYAGYNPVGDYVITTRTRDSDCLTRSNYECIFADMLNNPTGDDFVDDFRAEHWLCGWVAYIIMSKDAPESLLIKAAEIISALSDYPVYDENHWSEMECNEICGYWENMGLSERVGYCRDNEVSIFASRRDSIPGAVFDDLRDGWA